MVEKLDLKRVKVAFCSTIVADNYGGAGKLYDYLAPFDTEVGDLVVVEAGPGLAVAEVRTHASNNLGDASKYVVQKVDLSELEDLKARIAKAEMLKAEMDARIEALSYQTYVSKFAEDDPELKQLLDEYNNI